MINHQPILDVAKAEAYYSKKDGVPVKYVCTTALYKHADFAADIFYRETPHAEFGNHYFGLYPNQYANDAVITIVNADDAVAELNIDMIVDGNGDLHYSTHRHDYVEVGNRMIDGGRSYTRCDPYSVVKSFIIERGELIKNKDVQHVEDVL
jgi:hypothetical protein|tara:strand:+ start:1830 stop:2282 length:453 start_codon:yes stop_codon:yes gene_type:complete